MSTYFIIFSELIPGFIPVLLRRQTIAFFKQPMKITAVFISNFLDNLFNRFAGCGQTIGCPAKPDELQAFSKRHLIIPLKQSAYIIGGLHDR
jgi:hypothetical protein